MQPNLQGTTGGGEGGGVEKGVGRGVERGVERGVGRRGGGEGKVEGRVEKGGGGGEGGARHMVTKAGVVGCCKCCLCYTWLHPYNLFVQLCKLQATSNDRVRDAGEVGAAD
jgi:hypothetical protein